MTSNREQTGTIFTVTFRAPSGSAGIHALRAMLKVLLRRHGFRCIDATEEEATTPANVADALGQLRRDVNNRLRR
jgi:hypothetical protein